MAARYSTDLAFAEHAVRLAKLLEAFDKTLPEGICISPMDPVILSHYDPESSQHFESAHIRRDGPEWDVEFVELD